MMTSSGRELLKWAALVLMTGDHVNAAFFQRELPLLSEIARIAFPVFALVLGYNLATSPRSNRGQIIGRLLVFGILAQPFHAVALGLGVLPLNVLFTFAAAVAIIELQDRDYSWLSIGLFLAAGFVVDYQWAGLAMIYGAWRWSSSDSLEGWFALAAGFLAVCWFNGNPWALAAFPLVVLLGGVDLHVPRLRWAFYGYYVAHLVVLAVAVSFLPQQAPQTLGSDPVAIRGN